MKMKYPIKTSIYDKQDYKKIYLAPQHPPGEQTSDAGRNQHPVDEV